MKFSLSSTLTLTSGNQIPRFGLGVYKSTGQECSTAVAEALRAGYRHIDSAQAYSNEELVGKAVVESGVSRPDVYLTTKYLPTAEAKSPKDVLSVLRHSLPKIDPSKEGPHIDLMLLHSADGGAEGRANNWRALTEAQKEGWIHDIGVSNFNVNHFSTLPGPVPAVNQIELHPWCQQRPIVEYCKQHNIAVEAYSPLARADERKWNDPVVVELCKKHGKEPGQVVLRWGLQKGFIVIPKSVNPSRIRSNADIYDFELDTTDMEALDGLDQGAAGAVTWNPLDKYQ
ncbi:NADP-dependent oxidoreductase domain-containing protein [Kockovaella imperatae]|uniref:NADP-dependent oxidoreductase domain-containing protein n=1 Tax=Kockovaella imperatae TaxID=4999 RepID=A0A1Y1UHL6_9TREE|nr:NADP-dependent oxidoreductase domain-containing protein [Kockovaella imperatae]ORX37522.1 NADP-dependent oxidoreductase domain-containing protein [Kockovaella imperatae]